MICKIPLIHAEPFAVKAAVPAIAILRSCSKPQARRAHLWRFRQVRSMRPRLRPSCDMSSSTRRSSSGQFVDFGNHRHLVASLTQRAAMKRMNMKRTRGLKYTSPKSALCFKARAVQWPRHGLCSCDCTWRCVTCPLILFLHSWVP